jgi:hypothetical protein
MVGKAYTLRYMPVRCATCRRERTSTVDIYPPTDEANLIAFASWQKQSRVT